MVLKHIEKTSKW